MNYTYNPQNDTITITHPFDELFTRTVTFEHFALRAFVVDHLHWGGSKHCTLSSSQHGFAYLLCDGFGKITLTDYLRIGWDWSHIRDSSDEAIKEVAEFIAGATNTTIENVVTDARGKYE